ncbi:MAG: M28 family peptidase [Bacteroidaceae bacterium]|nr:M28 family peptidase [Bacteroidaceae bacterium]
MNKTIATIIAVAAVSLCSCKGGKQTAANDGADSTVSGPTFSADSAYAYTAAQCEFGPRTMNSKAHDLCGDYIAAKFKSFGCTVTEQHADLKGYDGTTLKARNIIASLNPDATSRIMICAHWDSRPWADNDPDEANHHKPVMAANDGASGVAVMLEMARIIGADSTMKMGIDFICFDAEDYGTPQWETNQEGSEDTWALGAQYWAENMHTPGYTAQLGKLHDMVGGQGAHFYLEGFSMQYAGNIMRRVWQQADASGFGSYFVSEEIGYVTDDHNPVNKAGIPCIDIINHAPDCPQSSFGPTWHTVIDDMQHIDRNTLKAVGQTVTDFIYN